MVSIIDVNGDNKPDLVLHIDGTDISTVLYNTGKGFVAQP